MTRRVTRREATASAPGRLDVMGGVADYSGSLLLQLPVAEETRVRLRRGGARYELRSHHLADGSTRTAEVAPDPAAMRAAPTWTRYVLGAVALASERYGLPLEPLAVDVESGVPIGGGLSSSAALEVATLRALTALYDLRWPDALALPRLAQRVEHEWVGAPCGLMDQLAVHCGTPGALLPIRCQPASVGAAIPLPPGLSFRVAQSHVEHSVGGRAYARARTAAFMGLRLLTALGAARDGYLANVPLADFEARWARRLPREMTGADFLARHGPHLDPQTTPRPGEVYPVRAASAHPIREHARVTAFAGALRAANAERRALRGAELRRLGALMDASHESYTAIGLGHPATDAIAAAARDEPGVYGARVTGGGAGGAVCVMFSPT